MCVVVRVLGWHDLDNREYDCWPLDKPDELNMIDCGGLPTKMSTFYYHSFSLTIPQHLNSSATCVYFKYSTLIAIIIVIFYEVN